MSNRSSYKYKRFLLILSTVLVSALLSMATVSGSTVSPSEDLDAARDAGLAFVSSVAPRWKTGWGNVSLTNPQPVYELDDEQVGYLFTVEQDSKVVGALVMGGQNFSYQPLELTAAPPHKSPDAAELGRSFSQRPELKGKAPSARPTGKFLYLGYQRIYEIFDVGDENVAFDLSHRDVSPTAELGSSLSKPQVRSSAVLRPLPLAFSARALASGGEYWSAWKVINGVPLYGQYDPAVQQYHPNNCGPTSGAMIVDYYRLQEGFTQFDGWTANHNAMYSTMKTDNWGPFGNFPGTALENFAAGFKQYANSKGYSFYAQASLPNNAQAWNDYLVGYIDVNRPLGVVFNLCTSAPDLHWNAIDGYGVWVDAQLNDVRYIVVNDPIGPNGGGTDTIINWEANWDCLGLVYIFPN